MVCLLILAGSFITALSGALAPGPLLTVTIAEGVKRGPIAGPLLISGHAVLEMGLTFLLLSGLSAYLNKDSVLAVTGIAGGIVLLYMGIVTLKSAPNLKVVLREDSANPKENSIPGSFLVLKGAVVSLSNPYWLIWWLTIGGAFLSRAAVQGFLCIAAFFIGHISADFLWYSLVSTGVHFSKERTGENLMRIVYLLCGVFLIFLSIYFAFDSLRRII